MSKKVTKTPTQQVKELKLRLAQKLFKSHFNTAQTDKGVLTYDGELEPDVSVYVNDNGTLIPAPDGEYRTEDGTVIVVEDGKVKNLKASSETLNGENAAEELEKLPEDAAVEGSDLNELIDVVSEIADKQEELEQLVALELKKLSDKFVLREEFAAAARKPIAPSQEAKPFVQAHSIEPVRRTKEENAAILNKYRRR